MSNKENYSETNVCEKIVYEQLFHNNYEPLRNFLYYRYGDMARAEDVIQESFAKIWQNCEKIILSTAKSYLYKIAINMTLNVIRDHEIALKYKSSRTDINFNTPEFELEEKEFKEKLSKAIESLPYRQREAFLLHRIEKKSYADISSQLGISIKAVEKRIHLALKSLKEAIGNYKI